ncbi:Inosose dehydratase [Baekduia alba]|uniref:sugar phosphate isomerase/epimerase family protein n=1 Tax=Baekduia alba TaxID=2997333 RepID=UPI002341DE82|nr:sugar phosphate isomerase/epimerase [Baekduia alba]WCB96485.1 Inosose dehydratase [Baekduia alba]
MDAVRRQPSSVRSALAGAPISWGVCEVPGWGAMLPPARVFEEMASLGLGATELGPVGDWLPLDAAAIRRATDAYDLQLVGGFVPLALHRDDATTAAELDRAQRIGSVMAQAGADTFVVALVEDDAWSAPAALDEAAWWQLATHLEQLSLVVADLGMTAVVHPHQGTLIERAEAVDRLASLIDVAWCLDPGHLALGGYDPLAFVERYGARVLHVHLKDIDLRVAARLNAGELTLMAAVQAGLFVPLGTGDAGIADVVAALDARGYDRWMVLEQDCAIVGPEPAPGDGPVLAVAESVRFLAGMEAAR